MSMIAEEITVECDEGGCYLHVDGETWRVADPEALYDRVKAAILPWLMERDAAHAEMIVGTPAYREWERAVAIREDGSLRMEPDEEPDDWRERLADNADWSRKAERENR